MLRLKGEQLEFRGWQVGGGSKWGRMQFAVVGVFLRPLQTSALNIYQANGVSMLDVDCFILNNVDASTLMESSLESICESVLSVVNESDIELLDNIGGANRYNRRVDYSTSNISTDFEVNDSDEYVDAELSIGIGVEDADNLDYYDDMYGFEDDDYDEDDDF